MAVFEWIYNKLIFNQLQKQPYVYTVYLSIFMQKNVVFGAS